MGAFVLFITVESALKSSGSALIYKGSLYVNSFGGVAQLVEHLPCKQGVSGSNPLTSTNPVFNGITGS